ncbi:MAG: reverse transcriptase domain-containing protein [Candidatus Thiodiazotropha sp.]
MASDSDDEKRIFKAEARANRKMKAEKGARRGRSRFWPYRRYAVRRAAETVSTESSGGVTQQTKKPGICFSCGAPGHWKNECLAVKTNPSSNNKISSNCLLPFKDRGLVNWSFQSVSDIGKEVIQTPLSLESLSEQETKGSNSTAGNDSNTPVGRLRSCIDKWTEITEDKYIIDVVKNGYKLPFKTMPPEILLKNNRSARENKSFVVEEIGRLLQKRVISEIEHAPHVVNPLTVAFSRSGKARLVLDCRHINEHLHAFKFKYEDIKIAEQMFEKGFYLFTFDLKGAYHHIDIFVGHRTYLGFSWTEGKETRYFVFNSLPFGISTAGHIFTKTLRVVVKFWRSKGHRIIMFLDDGIGGSSTFDHALISSAFVKQSLLSLGFLLADEKCNWKPCLQVVWLGNTLNMNDGKVYITEERISRLEVSIDSLLYQVEKNLYSLVHVKVLASVVGQIISLQNVIGKKVRLMTRQMYNCILMRASWNAPVIVTEQAKEELKFWRENVRVYNNEGKCMQQNTFAEICMFSDASSKGYGGYLEGCIESLEVGSSKYMVTGEDICLEVDKSKSTEVGNDSKSHEMGNEIMLEGKNLNSLEGGNVVYSEVGNIKSLEVGSKIISEERNIKALEGGNVVSGTGVSRAICNLSSKASLVNAENSSTAEIKGLFDDNFLKNSFGSSGIALSSNAHYVNSVSKICHKVQAEVIGGWTSKEMLKSSTWRETEAVSRVIKSNVNLLKNKRVKVYSDNKNVTPVLQTGSRKTELQEIACEVHEICQKYNIEIISEWIPRSKNEIADILSKCGDSDDWSIQNWVFEEINTKWGPHTVDRFASHMNTKCVRFNSKYWVPRTEGINGLDQQWFGEINWLVPPPCLITACIKKLHKENSRATLIVPEWPSAPYWPELVRSGGNFKEFILESIRLPTKNIISKGHGNNGIFAREPLSFNMLALKIKC